MAITPTTRMRFSSSSTVFHRVPTAGVTDDMATHDVGTSDAGASGIGGTGEFEIAADSAGVTYGTSHVVHTTSTADIGGNVAITKFVSIKHTGFQDEAKTTKTVTGTCLVTLGGPDASTFGGFTLVSGEEITLHGLNAECANLNLIEIITANESVYVEVVYL